MGDTYGNLSAQDVRQEPDKKRLQPPDNPKAEAFMRYVLSSNYTVCNLMTMP